MARKTGSHAEITGPRIRDAALRLFARHGYAAVSMRQIAREVGVQAGALYTYTPDKQALLYDLMESHLTDLLVAWEAEPMAPTPLARLEAFTRFHIRFHLDRPDAVFIAYMELRNLTSENYLKIIKLRSEYEAIPEVILTEGVERGAFHLPDIKLGVLAIIAMLTGVTTWYRHSGRLSPVEVEESYWQMVRGAVGVPR